MPRSRAAWPSCATGPAYQGQQRTDWQSASKYTASSAEAPTAAGAQAQPWPNWQAAQQTRCSTRQRSVLPKLRDITGESVQLYRRDGMQRVCVLAAEPPSGLRDTVPVGSRLPMTAGSGAKVLAAWSDPATQRSVLTDAVFGERTLLEVRRRGWAQSVAEREPGVASVSAPVRDSSGQVVAAVSVSGPVDRMGRRPGVRWAADLLAAAEALQSRL